MVRPGAGAEPLPLKKTESFGSGSVGETVSAAVGTPPPIARDFEACANRLNVSRIVSQTT